MDKIYISKKIEELRPWYQSIELDGIKTTDKKTSSIRLWNDIKTIMPKNLEGKSVLDIGANAGHYSIQSALLGAKVVCVERDDLAYSQFLFIKNYFENIHGDFNIKYIREDIIDLDFDKLGRFDYIFAISILYHLDSYKNNKKAVKTFPNQNRIIKKLTYMSDNIIIRIRNKNYSNTKHFNNIFKGLNFNPEIIDSTNDRTLIIYRKIGSV